MTVEQFTMISLGIIIQSFTFGVGLLVGACLRVQKPGDRR